MQPEHSQDDLLPSQTKDHKVSGFLGVGKEDISMGLPSNSSFDIGGSIYIVCMDGPWKTS